MRRKVKETNSRSRAKLFILPGMLILCTFFYYFGELVDWAAWEALRVEFYYGIHDIHRLLFLAPIIYAGYTARVKGATIVTLVAFIIFLPRVFFISPFPDPLLRMVFFTIIAGVIGSLVGIVRNKSELCLQLETAITNERNKPMKIADGMADGIIITGPDYIIRYMNSRMVNNFGDGTGLPCYKHFFNLDSPCGRNCRITDVINQSRVYRWECGPRDHKSFEIIATPYIDSDGTICQLSVLRSFAPHKES